MDDWKKKAEKKYRKKQAEKGLVRFQLQVDSVTKALFDELVHNEIKAQRKQRPSPLTRRQQETVLRAEVFEKAIEGNLIAYAGLNERIRALEEESKALSPYLQPEAGKTTRIPKAIRELPNDEELLKKQIALLHRELNETKANFKKYKNLSDQYRALYEASNENAKAMKVTLKKHGLIEKEKI